MRDEKITPVIRKFEQSLDITKKSRKQIRQVLAFLLIVAGLLYYICRHSIHAVNLQPGDYFQEDLTQIQANSKDFFVEFKLSREKIQKEQIDLVTKVINDKDASPQVRDEAHLQYLAIIDALGKELKIEGILQAKGLESLALLSGDSCTVVVNAINLDETAVAQIGDAVRRITRIGLQNITVVPTQK